MFKLENRIVRLILYIQVSQVQVVHKSFQNQDHHISVLLITSIYKKCRLNQLVQLLSIEN